MWYSPCHRVGAVRSARSSQKLPRLDLYFLHTHPALHLIAADTGCTVVDDTDDLCDQDDLDHDLSEVSKKKT